MLRKVVKIVGIVGAVTLLFSVSNNISFAQGTSPPEAQSSAPVPQGSASAPAAQSSAQAPANVGEGKSPAQIAGLYVYPQKNQDATLQAKDEGECFESAKQGSGFDPTAPKTAAATPTNSPQGGGVKGSAKGAAGGAAVGAIAGDAGTGAAVGATVGAVSGRRRQKKEKQQAEQQAQQAAATAQNQQLDSFRRAMSACLDARGYSVK